MILVASTEHPVVSLSISIIICAVSEGERYGTKTGCVKVRRHEINNERMMSITMSMCACFCRQMQTLSQMLCNKNQQLMKVSRRRGVANVLRRG